MGRVAIFGDIGGHAAELTRELVSLGADPDTLRLPADLTVVQVGDLVTLAPGSSFTDPGADAPWTWFYDWGDGVTTRGGTSTHDLPPNGHRYATPGTYQLRISVRDDRGYGHAAAP